jgi:pseudouridine synthase
MVQERLQKVLASAGIGSRRACEELIRQGRVSVNGKVVTELGVKVDPARDRIEVDGERIRPSEPYRYILLHKPAGYLSVMKDPRGRPDLGDLVQEDVRLFPVGRLDMASEGLILLTNDGELANQLMHPRYEQSKTYLVLVRGQPKQRTLTRLRRGVKLEEGRTAPAQVEVVQGWPRELKARWWREAMPQEKGPTTWLRMTLREGKKREIRRMLSAVGHPVLRLIRIGLGPLRLGNLPPGESRPLTARELRLLQAASRGRKVGSAARSGGERSRPRASTTRRRKK